MKILLIEDDIDLGNLLKEYLEMNNIEVCHAKTGESAIQLLQKFVFDLVIIDIMLPDTNGFEIAKSIKKQTPDLPFLLITAKNTKDDVIAGLKLGAEDYITKPFEPEELILRINIILRRNLHDDTEILEIGESVLKLNEYKLYTQRKEYKLTQKETELLAFIIKNKNRLIKRETMLKKVWGENDYFLGRSMDVFVSRLRKYFKDDQEIDIETFRGVGYIFRDK